MDDSVQKYRERRAERLANKKSVRMDAVDQYRERRRKRLESRMDAGVGWVFGALKDAGIDTSGMDVGEAFEKWNEINKGNGGGKKAEVAPKAAKGEAEAPASKAKKSAPPAAKNAQPEQENAQNKPKNVQNKPSNVQKHGLRRRFAQTTKARDEYRNKFEHGEDISEPDALDKGDILTDGVHVYVVEKTGKNGVGIRRYEDDTGDFSEVGANELQKMKKVDAGKTRYSNKFDCGNGAGLPTPAAGTVYERDTLEEVRRLAEEMDGGEGLANTVKKLSEDAIRYQKDPDGTIVATIPGVANVYDHVVEGKGPEVQKEYDRRIEAGKKVVDDMMKISDALGSRMVGLENCFKGGRSTARKIDKVKNKLSKAMGREVSDEEAFASMDDVVRFTYKCDHANMAKQVQGLEEALAKQGYEVTDRDNKFLPDLDDYGNDQPRAYKAVHLQVKSPTGELFEVQIQSEASLQVKNKNHRYFEEQRQIDLDKNPELAGRLKELQNIMVDNTSKMPLPDGIMDLKPTGKSAAKAEKKQQKIEENMRKSKHNS